MATMRAVVLGAGFAGLAACDVLARDPERRFEVVVVDRHTYNTFQPLLYQVATAGLNPGDIAFPVRSYLRRHPEVIFRKGTVRDVDFASRLVHLEDDDEPLSYDYLVVATGATTNYFGVAGARDHSHAIYTMEDAIAVRDHILDALEHAATFGASHGELAVVLVGGGATGVEMAGTLAELRNVELETVYRNVPRSAARIVLVEQQSRLLAGFSPEESAYALGALRARGVEVLLDTAVEEVCRDHVVLAGGHELACGIVIWSAGVSAGELADRLKVPQTRGGRISVGADLRLAEHPEVFVAGDVAAPDPGDGPLVAQLAQPAIQEGRHAGRQLLALASGRPVEPFVYADKGIMATIGRRAAVAEFPNGLKLRGTAAWLSWLGLHIVFLLGFRNRVAVLVNWAWRYLWWRRGTRVIAGT